MAKIDLTKPGSTPRPLRTSVRPIRAYLMLGFGAFDLIQRSPIGVVFVALGCYLLFSARSAPASAAPDLGSAGARRADEVMALATTALPDWWTVEQYRARVVPVGDAQQPAFPLVDLQGQVTGAIARADLDQVARADASDVRLRDVARRVRRSMVLITRESSLGAVAGPVLQHDAVAVVINADRQPLGVITRSEIAHANERAA